MPFRLSFRLDCDFVPSSSAAVGVVAACMHRRFRENIYRLRLGLNGVSKRQLIEQGVLELLA
jgi:hypothetical protein